MHFLVTAGPTREHLDDVRFLSNASSGRMGYAIARAAAKAGHRVDLVSGVVALSDPPGVRVTRVVSTEQMHRAAAKLFPKTDCLIGAAAPADFRPARRVRGKAKKADASMTLELKPTIDILRTLGKRKRKQIVISFALEVGKPIANALAKLRQKNADAVVLNTPAAMGADKANATVLLKNGDRIELPNATKRRIAKCLVLLAEQLRADAASVPRH